MLKVTWNINDSVRPDDPVTTSLDYVLDRVCTIKLPMIWCNRDYQTPMAMMPTNGILNKYKLIVLITKVLTFPLLFSWCVTIKGFVISQQSYSYEFASQSKIVISPNAI